MNGKRRVNLASIWIIVIFTVIAVTLVAIFAMVYSSVLNREKYAVLREEATQLADSADYQIMEPLRSGAAQRLSGREGLAEIVLDMARSDEADAPRIQTLSQQCAAVCAVIAPCEKVCLYFPGLRMAVGSDGVHFPNDKKYTVNKSNYDFLAEVEPDSTVWMR